jgi:hypothetical protein
LVCALILVQVDSGDLILQRAEHMEDDEMNSDVIIPTWVQLEYKVGNTNSECRTTPEQLSSTCSPWPGQTLVYISPTFPHGQPIRSAPS